MKRLPSLILAVLLVIPGTVPAESTFKLQVSSMPLFEFLYQMDSESGILTSASFTWGECFYGGPIVYSWDMYYPAGTHSYYDIEENTAYQGFGAVCGFHLARDKEVSFHIQLGAFGGWRIGDSYDFGGLPILNFGPGFRLSDNLRLTFDVDVVIMYFGLGVGLNYTF